VHPVIGARVAIKVLRPEVAVNPSVVERFFNEARAVNLIGHRNVVRILDLASERGYYFCVMELLEGEPLSTRLAGGRRMPFSVAGPILLQCAEALEAAHQRKIIHRDIKPDNIFLVAEKGQRDFVKVVDFGIAKLTASGIDVARTSAGVVMGTPAYMSPEQAEGAAELDGRSDIYSLGVMTFQMATGRLPFLEAAHVQVMMAHLTTQPPLPTAIAPQTPKPLERLILRCLAKSPDERYPSMAALHEALRAAMAECGLEQGGAAVSGATEPSLPPAVAGPPAPPAIPPMGGGLEGEPLPGAEMFEVFEPARADNFERAAGAAPFQKVEGSASLLAPQPLADAPPLELDLPPPAPPPAPGEELAPAEPVGAGVVAPIPPPPKRSASGVMLALGLVACAGVLLLVFADKPSAPARQEREAAREPVQKAAEKTPQAPLVCPPRTSKAPGPGPLVTLQIRSVPDGAQVRALWPPAGCKVGPSPLDLEVSQGARVHLALQAPGFALHEADVQANNSQVVLESLAE
jgi:hypothetical protein